VESIVDPVSGADRIDTTAQQKKEVAKQLRELLVIAYKGDDQKKFIDALNDHDTVELARREMDGIRVATPVFDAARETDIQALLKVGGMPEEGKVQLYDGRTGEAFAE